MDNDIWSYLGRILKHIFSMKRTKIALYVAAVLWVAVAAQITVNKAFQKELQITEAFIKSDTEEMQSSLEIAAEYNTEFLSDQDKRDIILKLAKTIGLTVTGDIKVWEEDGKIEYFYFKQAKQASTQLKVISIGQPGQNAVKMKHYIIARINVLKGIESIDSFKNSLEAAITKMDVINKQVTVKYEGTREGDLTAQQKHDIAALLVNELQGNIALEYDEGDLYTVYAYTGMLNEYITSTGTKINIQIAITYNELTNKTKIALASPVLAEDY